MLFSSTSRMPGKLLSPEVTTLRLKSNIFMDSVMRGCRASAYTIRRNFLREPEPDRKNGSSKLTFCGVFGAKMKFSLMVISGAT